MTEFGEMGETPRVDVWLMAGAAALTRERYERFVADLDELQWAYGIMPRPVTDPAEMAAASAYCSAAAETETNRTPLTRRGMDQFAAERGVVENNFVRDTWRALHRIIDEKDRTKRGLDNAGGIERRLGESEKGLRNRRFLASLDLQTLEDVPGDKEGKHAIDMHSLYQTLLVVLEDGYPTGTSPLPRMGVKRLSFLAELVNARLQPDEPLPIHGEIELEPLSPRYPRTLNVDSPHVLRAWRGKEVVGVVSRDQLHNFAVGQGFSSQQIPYLLQMFEDLARHLNGTLIRPERTDQQQWIGSNDVFFVGTRRVEGGYNRSIWGIELGQFINLVYEMEASPDFRKKVHGVGLRIRQLFREYLDEVAPYVPETE